MSRTEKRTDQVSDQELVLQAQKGQRRAFQQLVLRYQSKVFGIALSWVRNRTDAEDLVQEAFLRAYKSIPRFQGKSSFYTWIYRITVNLCHDHARKRPHPGNPEFDETLGWVAEESENNPLAPSPPKHPEKALDEGELGARVRAALAELPEIHRQVLHLREVEDMSYEEIAEVLDCQVGTVMSRLFHARKKMQKLLKPYLESGV